MSIQSNLLSSNAGLMVGLACHVHPVVLLSIVDSYERRNEDAKRVIGTLLGTIEKGIVEVSNCFTVPHNESEEEVAVDIEFAKNMYDLHKKVNSLENIVGWYSTGFDVSEHSVLIHEYYTRECKNPIHLTVDTSLRYSRMSMKAYISIPFGVPDKTMGSMFKPIHLELTMHDPERVGVDVIQSTKDRQRKTIPIDSDLQQVTTTCENMLNSLSGFTEYVDNVLNGSLPADSSVGRLLMDLVNTVPRVKQEDFDEMMNANMKDLLMLVYLSNLTKTQLLISEKLSHL